MGWIRNKKKVKTSSNDLLIRTVLYNTAPVTRKAPLHYKSLFHKELKAAERTQKSIKVWRRVLFPLKGLVLIQTLTNAGTVGLPRRGYFLLCLELVCLESDFPILDGKGRLNRRSRMFFYLENNPIHPRASGSRGLLLVPQLPRSDPSCPQDQLLACG